MSDAYRCEVISRSIRYALNNSSSFGAERIKAFSLPTCFLVRRSASASSISGSFIAKGLVCAHLCKSLVLVRVDRVFLRLKVREVGLNFDVMVADQSRLLRVLARLSVVVFLCAQSDFLASQNWLENGTSRR